MFYHLKIAFRNLRRNGVYSWINITGLALSLTTCIFLALWIQDELSFDRFHKNCQQIYRINAKMDREWYWETSPAPLAGVTTLYPEITAVCRISEYYTNFFEYEHTKFVDITCRTVDDNFFSFFTFPLLSGNPERPFPDDLSLIISETKAKVLFGDDDPLGKVIQTSDSLFFHVVGVVKDAPKNSSIQFDFLIPYLARQKTYKGNWVYKHIDDDWGSYFYQTFILLQKNAAVKTIEQQISAQVSKARNAEIDEVDEEAEEYRKYEFVLQPLGNIHLYEANLEESSRLKTVSLLTLIAVFVLIIACINYINLTTARAIKRSKEIAIRKILGGVKRTLFAQLMRETLVLLLVALVAAAFLVYLLTPVYSALTAKTLTLSLDNYSLWTMYGIMAIGVVVLTGIYPALSLSSFSPLRVFPNSVTNKRKQHYLRKILVVFQFVISFVLIAGTITINAQIRYLRNKELGYEQKNIFTMAESDNLSEHYDAVRNELLKNSDIIDVTAGQFNNMMATSWRKGVDWPGKPENFFMPIIYTSDIQTNFLDFMNIPIVAGEPFSPSDTAFVLINEEAARLMNFENPIGHAFYLNNGGDYYTIKGVVKDFHFDLLNEKISPLIISHKEWNASNFIYVKTTPEGAKSALATAEKIWKEYEPDYNFQYMFLEENFEHHYKAFIYIEQLLSLFAIIAIFISCLGLFGLVTYTAETKTKEIAIRKTLGASVGNIVAMLSKEFLILVGIAMLMAFPAAYYFMNKMLQDYAYRITVDWRVFALSGLITVLLTLLAVGWQVYRAAVANPATAIKTE